MKKFGFKKKLGILALSLGICTGVFGANLCRADRVSPVQAISYTDTTSYVSVGELWNAEDQVFNKDNLSILKKYISGKADATIADINEMATNTSASDIMRAKTLDAGTQGDITYTAKTAEQDIIVRLGGLDWEVMYLSKDKSGNSILTLWLSNNKQDAWAGRASDEGEYYGFIDGALYSRWSCFSYGSDAYPANMYGISYVNAVTLNNGGMYSAGSKVTTGVEKSVDNVFAYFTMEQFGLTEYIVTPRSVSWQENQSAKTIINAYYNYPNDAWSKDTPDTGFYSAEYNYAKKDYSDAWADSYIWLPSMCETGSNDSQLGLWKTSINQRMFANGVSSGGSVGKSSTSASNNAWLRSGNDNGSSMRRLYENGRDSYSSSGTVCHAIRPSLHLNLSSVELSLTHDTISKGEMSVSPASSVYDGTIKSPTVAVTLNGESLAENSDYTLEYSLNGKVVEEIIDAGEYTISAKGCGNFIGRLSAKYTVTQRDLSNATLTGIENKTYSGSAQTQNLTLSDLGGTLVENTDYTVSYSNNTNAGTATITITGKGNYTGTITPTFEITPLELADSSDFYLSYLDQITYRAWEGGGAFTPKVRLYYISQEQTEGKDYTVAYSNNTNAGMGSVIVTGMGNFTGTLTGPLEIFPRPLGKSSESFFSVDDDKYNGDALTPNITLREAGETLILNQDYTATYSNNINAGTGSVTVTGINNYENRLSKNFTIYKRGMGDASISTIADQEYTGSYITPTPTITYNGKTLTKEKDYTLKYSNNFDITTRALVTITGTGNFSGSTTKNFKIVQSDISKGTLTLDNTTFAYTGNNIVVNENLVKNGTSLIRNTDYTYTIKSGSATGTTVTDIKNVGIYYVVLDGINNYTGTISASFEITSVDLSTSGTIVLSEIECEYADNIIIPNFNVKLNNNIILGSTDYTYEIQVNGKEASPIDVGNYTIVVTGKNGYVGSVSTQYTITPRNITGSVVVLESDNFDYTGLEIRPEVSRVIINNDMVYFPNTNSIVYSDNIGAGTANVDVKGEGNFTGTASITFSINKVELDPKLIISVDGCAFVNGVPTVNYSGSAIVPKITVKDKNGKIVDSENYEVLYGRVNEFTEDFTSAGTIIIAAIPKYNSTTRSTNYSGMASGTVDICPIDMTDAEIEIIGTYEYNNVEIIPTFKVYKDSSKQQEISSTLYTTTFSNNINAGNAASVAITFSGNYVGSATRLFTINRRNISNWTFDYTIPEFVYDGNQKSITWEVSDTNKADLTKQYTYRYLNNINAGTATIEFEGVNNYIGTISKTFKISPKSIENMTISTIPNQDYTGSEIRPSIEVKIDSTHILDASNYTVDYSNNIMTGQAGVVVSGKGNYIGSISSTFEIMAVEIGTAQIKDIPDITYTLSEISPKPELTLNGAKLFENTDYTLSYSNNTNVGTATITISGMGAFVGTTTKTFKIIPASVENISLRGIQDAYTYTGAEINTLHINNLYFNGRLISYSGDTQAVTVSYANNINVGIATLTITPYSGATNSNFTGTKTIEFTISKADLAYDMISLSTIYYTYTGSSITPKPTVVFDNTTLEEDVDYTLSYSTDTTNVGTKVVTITAKDTSNFSGSVSVNYYIKPKSISGVTIADIDSIIYTREELQPSLVVTDGSLSLVYNIDYTIEYSNNINVGTANVVVRGKGNYLTTTTKSATFEITPATIDSMTLTNSTKVFDRKTSSISANSVKAGTIQLTANEYALKFYRNDTETRDLTNAGTIVVKVHSTSDNFKIETEVNSQFTIIPATISTVTLFITETTYSKFEQKPTVSKIMSNNNLTLNASEYSIDYLRGNISTSDFVNAGKITVRILSNNSNFQIVDIVESEYDILPKSITDSDIVTKYYFVEYKNGEYVFLDLNGNGTRVYMEDDQKYIAYLVHPEIKFDGTEIAKGTDYDFTIKNEITDNDIETSTSFVNVGAYLININAKGNYTGTIQERFKVNAREFTPDNVTVEFRNGKDFEYSGSLIKLDLANVLKLTYIQDGITSEIVLEGSETASSESASYKLYDAYDEGKDYLEYTDDQGNTIEIKFDEGNFGYINNINAGKAMVFLKGVRNFSGVIGIEFNITPRNINDEGFVFELSDTTSLVYTGKEHKPTLKTHTFSTTNLVENVDYSLTYLNNINAGTAKAIITGRNNFVGTKEIDFVIAPKALTSDMLLTISNAYYNGSEQKPNINLVYNSMSLVEDGDYTISYNTGADFVNANTITITITAKSSNYSGSFDSTYTILPRNLRSIILSSSKSIYNRELHTISFVVRDMDNLIVEQNASNLSVKYYSGETEVTEIINAGTYVIQVSGLNNYTGTLSANYIVSNASVGIEMLTNITDQIYTMKPITPSVSMNYLSQPMQKDTEYTYTFANNTNVGVAEIRVEGVGNFAGSFTGYFNIVPKDLNDLSYDESIKLSTKYTGLTVLPGSEQFERLITFDDYKLVLNKDFVIYTTNNSVNTGLYNLQIKGIGNYTGTLSRSFEILAMEIDSDNISISGVVSKTYTGLAITQNFALTNLLSNSQLYLNSDFTVSYSENINVAWLDGTEDSKAQITITAKGNYTGQRTIYFTILAKDLGSSDIIIASIDPVVYTGSAQTPKPEVKFVETILDEKIIEYSYLNNTEYGRASVIISAKPNTNFKGSVTRYFEIGLTQMDDVIISKLDDVVYNGTEQKLEPVITSKGVTLVKDQDYTLSYSNDTINAGTITITIRGKGNFAGLITTTYNITPIEIKKQNDVVISEITDITFTGREVSPQPEIKFNSTELILSRDYTLSYSNNINVTTEAIVNIVFTGNYSGNIVKNFTIVAKTLTADMISGLTTQTYTGNPINPNFEIIYNLTNFLSENDFILNYRSNIDVGTAYIDITGKNNFVGSITAEFEIVARTLTIADIDVKVLDECVYSGVAFTPKFEVSIGANKLTLNDYSYSYGANINAGDGEIYLTFKGNYAGNVTVTFTISQASVNAMTVNVSNNTIFDGTSHTPNISLKFKDNDISANDYDISYFRNDTETLDFVNAGEITIRITGKNNFQNSRDLKYIISPRSLVDVSIGITSSDLIYTGSSIEPQITVAFGAIVLESDDYSIQYSNNINASNQAKIIITANNNTNFSGSKEQSFTIQPKTLNVAFVQDIESLEYSSKEQTPNITIVYNGIDLIKDTDFTVSYLNNTNVGVSTAQITGIGNFAGTISKQFNITTCSIANAKVENLQNSYTFTLQEIKPAIVVKVNNTVLTLGEDYILDYEEDSTNVGTKSIIITGINNYSNTKVVSYSINAKNLNDSEIKISGIEDKKYALGSEITQDFMLKHNDNIILMSDSYSVTYTNNINAGSATITIVGKGNYIGTKIVTFNILKLTPEVVVACNETKLYENNSVILDITASSTAGRIVTDRNKYLAGEYTYNWTFLPNDSVNFESVTGQITLSAIALEIVDIEFAGNYKREYQAYDNLNISNLIVNLKYNSGKIEQISQEKYSINIKDGNILNMDSRVIITYNENINISKELPIYIIARKISISEYEPKLFVANGEKQYLSSIKFNGEIASIPVTYKLIYQNITNNTTNEFALEKGKYRIFVEILDYNYSLQDGVIELEVKSKIINSSDNNLVVEAPNGFGIDESFGYDVIVDKNLALQALGITSFGNSNSFVAMYQFELEQNKNIYVTFKPNMSDLSKLQVFKLVNGKLQQVNFSKLQDGKITINCNSADKLCLFENNNAGVVADKNDSETDWVLIIVIAVLFVATIAVVFIVINKRQGRHSIKETKSEKVDNQNTNVQPKQTIQEVEHINTNGVRFVNSKEENKQNSINNSKNYPVYSSNVINSEDAKLSKSELIKKYVIFENGKVVGVKNGAPAEIINAVRQILDGKNK